MGKTARTCARCPIRYCRALPPIEWPEADQSWAGDTRPARALAGSALSDATHCSRAAVSSASLMALPAKERLVPIEATT